MDIQDALTAASIAISVAGIVIAAWQMTVKHARIAVVAPLLVGAFVIAATAQIARMLI